MKFELIVLAYSFFLIPFCCLYAGKVTQLFKIPPASYPPSFSKPLEALRGIAAITVVMSHTTMYFYATGNGAGSKASSFLGQSGVIWFFMLTGYLFWNMVLSDRLNLNTFYEKRIRRLVPAMVGMVTAALIYEWGLAHFPVPTGGQLLAALKNYFFYFSGVNQVFYPDIVLRINNLWTLRWEWLFYLSLPIIAAITRRWLGLTVLLCVASLVLTDVVANWRTETDAALFLAFYFGMSSAMLERHIQKNGVAYRSAVEYLTTPLTLLIVLLVAVSTLSMPHELIRSHNLQFVMLNAPVFLWFLLLNSSDKKENAFVVKRSVLDLGRISYSVYLWHLLIAYMMHKLFAAGTLPGLDSKIMYIAMPVMVVLVTIPVATLSYKYLELPFMSAVKRLSEDRTRESVIGER